jgi:UDP-2-acetamido-3-amino-2,3-dideoxy-glucuronate N-acetyltransferase
MDSSEKSIGLVGLGYWGRHILRNFCDLGVVNTACDCDPNIIAERNKEFPDVHYCTSFEEILRNPVIKAVAIATSASSHYEYTKQSLLAGKDVFVEKPLSLTVEEGKELVGLAEREKRILMVGHILHYHPAVMKLKELISSGEIGKIQYLYSNRLNIGKLRTEENILWSLAPHDISVILMLLGEEPANISAFGGDYLNNGTYDVTLTTMEFKNGIKAHIFVSWLHPFKEQKLVVVGSKAMIVFDDVSDEKLFLYPHKIEWRDGKIPIAQKANPQTIPVDSGEPLRQELSHFIECIRKRKRLRTDGNEGLRVLKVLESVEKSLLRKKGHKTHETTPNYFVHESAYVDEGVQIGDGTKIWHFSHVQKGSRIGKSCIIGQNVFVGSDVRIGNGCKVQNNVSVYKGVVLEDEVFCGPSCVFTNVYNPRALIDRKHEFRGTLVKKGATIGANATIICGVTIGKYAMVGAGSVVKSSLRDYAIVAGVPARQIGWACRCGTTLRFNNNHAACTNCDREYGLEKDSFKVIHEELD